MEGADVTALQKRCLKYCAWVGRRIRETAPGTNLFSRSVLPPSVHGFSGDGYRSSSPWNHELALKQSLHEQHADETETDVGFADMPNGADCSQICFNTSRL